MTRSYPLSQIRVAAGQAIAEGKAIVTTDGGVLVLSYHPLTRIAPSVEGDGFALADDDLHCSDCPDPHLCRSGCVGPTKE